MISIKESIDKAITNYELFNRNHITIQQKGIYLKSFVKD